MGGEFSVPTTGDYWVPTDSPRNIVAKAGTEVRQIEFPINQMTQRELEGTGQDLPLEIHRDHLQTVVGGLEARHREAPVGDAELYRGHWADWREGRVFLQPQRST